MSSEGAKYLPTCISEQLQDAWGLHKSQLELCQVTFRRICYLHFAPHDTVTYVHGGRLARALFSNHTQLAVYDVSVWSDEDGAWHGQVHTAFAQCYPRQKTNGPAVHQVVDST
ncbi:hypothetical protein Vafri_12020 [Volvox africanus]|uniref:Uncharacterized protein n=1 Tax=Volvox africanus TaxID=51714 RepID=A0A8J4B981_9CHLO|nr:hypothetical protein Vafri_470 [Volvox africanus]GIL56748.1 hypothetical protein Vafri_12020 [Volvox africanus]